MQIYFMLAVQWTIGMILKINSNMHSIWFCCGFYHSVSVQLEYMQVASLLPELPVALTQLWNNSSHTEFSLSLIHTVLSQLQSDYLAIVSSYIANIGSILHVQPLFLATMHLYDDFCVSPASGRQRTEAWALHRTVVKCRRGLERQVNLCERTVEEFWETRKIMKHKGLPSVCSERLWSVKTCGRCIWFW